MWNVFSANGRLSGRLMGSFDGVMRTSTEQDAVASVEGTAMLGWRLSKQATLWAGGGISRIQVPGAGEATLHRGRQQLNIALGKLGKATIASRTMLEERWWVGRGNSAGVRLREQIRLMQPIGTRHHALFLTTEPIWNLNSTVWGQRAGLNRLRSSAGVSLALTAHLRGELGYLNDYDFRQNRADREIHAALTTLALTF